MRWEGRVGEARKPRQPYLLGILVSALSIKRICQALGDLAVIAFRADDFQHIPDAAHHHLGFLGEEGQTGVAGCSA